MTRAFLSTAAFLSFLAVAIDVRADTLLAGGNVINQTWTLAGSPYIVQGDLTIPTGAFLTIHAGVQVLFTATDNLGAGLNPGKVEINVNGTLTVQGTPASQVLFQAQTGTAAATWYGIVVGPSATSVVITGTILRHAVIGISNNAAGTVFQLNQSTLTTNQTGGLLLAAGAPTMDQLTFSNNGIYGLIVSGGPGPTVTNGLFVGNAYGLYLANSTAATTTLLNCVVHGNSSYGIYTFLAASASVVVKNSIITQNALAGIYNGASAGTHSISFTDLYGNGTAVSGVALGSGCLAVDPLFVSASTDFRLQPGSPCIDAGTVVSAAFDFFGSARPIDGDGLNGAEFDLGIYEAGPGDAPVLADPGNWNVDEGELLAFLLSATDANGDPLTYSSSTLPAGAVLDPNNGAFTWTPDADASAGSPYSVTFTVSDGILAHSRMIQITVADVPAAPPARRGGGCGLLGPEVAVFLFWARRRRSAPGKR
jgi:hypothetical protein